MVSPTTMVYDKSSDDDKIANPSRPPVMDVRSTDDRTGISKPTSIRMVVAEEKSRDPGEHIYIVGAGVVGTAMARGFIRVGHKVTLIDILRRRVEALVAEGLNARCDLDFKGDKSDYIFLALPTPSTGRRYNLTILEEGVRAVGRALATAHHVPIVVVSSTVPPGTSENIAKPLLEQYSRKMEGAGFFVAHSPEFIRSASAEEDFAHPRMTVIGATSPSVRARLAALMMPFGGEFRLFDNPKVVEMIKCAHNLFNATKISFWNEKWRVCRCLGIDPDEVAETVARSAEGSFNPLYGIRDGKPFGGECLPKDTRGFLGVGDDCDLSLPLIEAVVDVNDIMTRSDFQRGS